jgi:cytochrome o ubiquinol oxidase subunit 1
MIYWFPKAFVFRLHEGWGKAAFWFSVRGVVLVFVPFYILGLEGMTRRLQHIDVPEWAPWLYVSTFGVAVMLVGVFCQVMQLVVSIRNREALRDVTGDPWNGR